MYSPYMKTTNAAAATAEKKHILMAIVAANFIIIIDIVIEKATSKIVLSRMFYYCIRRAIWSALFFLNRGRISKPENRNIHDEPASVAAIAAGM